MRAVLIRAFTLLVLPLSIGALASSCRQPPESPPQEDPWPIPPLSGDMLIKKPPLSCHFIGDGRCPPDAAVPDAAVPDAAALDAAAQDAGTSH